MAEKLTAFRGDTFRRRLAFTDSDTGAVVDITGWKIFMTIKRDVEQTDALADATMLVTSHTNATGGITTITIPAGSTVNLEGVYYYDIQYVTTAGIVRTAFSGTITFTEDVTVRIT